MSELVYALIFVTKVSAFDIWYDAQVNETLPDIVRHLKNKKRVKITSAAFFLFALFYRTDFYGKASNLIS